MSRPSWKPASPIPLRRSPAAPTRFPRCSRTPRRGWKTASRARQPRSASAWRRSRAPSRTPMHASPRAPGKPPTPSPPGPRSRARSGSRPPARRQQRTAAKDITPASPALPTCWDRPPSVSTRRSHRGLRSPAAPASNLIRARIGRAARRPAASHAGRPHLDAERRADLRADQRPHRPADDRAVSALGTHPRSNEMLAKPGLEITRILDETATAGRALCGERFGARKKHRDDRRGVRSCRRRARPSSTLSRHPETWARSRIRGAGRERQRTAGQAGRVSSSLSDLISTANENCDLASGSGRRHRSLQSSQGDRSFANSPLIGAIGRLSGAADGAREATIASRFDEHGVLANASDCSAPRRRPRLDAGRPGRRSNGLRTASSRSRNPSSAFSRTSRTSSTACWKRGRKTRFGRNHSVLDRRGHRSGDPTVRRRDGGNPPYRRGYPRRTGGNPPGDEARHHGNAGRDQGIDVGDAPRRDRADQRAEGTVGDRRQVGQVPPARSGPSRASSAKGARGTACRRRFHGAAAPCRPS